MKKSGNTLGPDDLCRYEGVCERLLKHGEELYWYRSARTRLMFRAAVTTEGR